jgi:hypothetical protein
MLIQTYSLFDQVLLTKYLFLVLVQVNEFLFSLRARLGHFLSEKLVFCSHRKNWYFVHTKLVNLILQNLYYNSLLVKIICSNILQFIATGHMCFVKKGEVP